MRKETKSATASRNSAGNEPENRICSPDDIHVWLVSFDFSESKLTSFRKVLSMDERERADRYLSEDARSSFIAARGTLRCILSRYLSTDPADIVFAYNGHGRPSVEFPPETSRTAFNLSHSANKALYAISSGVPVGVDVEKMRSLDFTGISKRFFAPTEAAALASLPATEQINAFFECWTRKEAFAKAMGTGLYLDLAQVEVSLGPGVPPRIVQIRGSEENVDNWSLHNIDAGEGFKAALAVESKHVRLIMQDQPTNTICPES